MEKVLEEALSQDQKAIYINRKTAVDLYIDGNNISDIERTTGIKRCKLSQLVTKCCTIDAATHEPYGYTALIPYKRLKKYSPKESKSNTTANSGSFENLLLTYPSLKAFIKDNYFGNKDATLEKNMNISTLHKKLLFECHRLGIQDYEYPFNSLSKGSRLLRRYVECLSKQNQNLAIKRENKDARQKYKSTGKGTKHSVKPRSPYSLVQLDGHKIDMLYTVPVINNDGSTSYLPATRLCLIAVIDTSTRTILGYSISCERNYNQFDVLSAIKDSIVPRNKISFTIPGFEYPGNGGFPCFAFKECNWAVFDSIMLDNAKSHLAHNVMDKLTDKLKIAVNFGSVATPETRGIVERFFGTLEENGYHRMPSTTGSNVRDTRRENAEKDAIKYSITYNDIIELTEYLIAIYNNSPHSALNGRTPLQVLEDRIQNAGMTPYIADTKMKEKVNQLTNIIVERTVRGAYESGKRPYISFEGVTYRNEAMGISSDLVGTKVLLDVNPDDISTILAYTDDGSELGYLRASGVWGNRPHSLKTRKEAMKYTRENMSKNNPFFAPLTEYENLLKERAAKSRNYRTKAERIHREQETRKTEDYKLNNDDNGRVQHNIVDFKAKVEDTNNTNINKTISNLNNPSINIIDELDGLSFEEAYARGLFK